MMNTMTTMIMMTTTTLTTARATTRILFGSRLLWLDLACCLFRLVCSDKECRRNGDLHSRKPYSFAFRVPLRPSQSYLWSIVMGPQHWRTQIPRLRLVRFLLFLRLVLLLIYSRSESHVHPTPSSERRSHVPAAVDKAQGNKAYSVLTITMRHSKIRNKDVHVRYFTSSSASHIPFKNPVVDL